jgi:DnaJ-domain-containing protein 1
MAVDDWRLSTAAPHRKDGLPYADSSPDDPGAVVRWSVDNEQYCVACDQYTWLRDNIRAIGLYIDEKRKMAQRPIQTGQNEFATARLPSAGQDDLVAVGPGDSAIDDPAAVLEVDPDASEAVIRAAYSERVKKAHPDQGGSREEMERVRRAREQLLSDRKGEGQS